MNIIGILTLIASINFATVGELVSGFTTVPAVTAITVVEASGEGFYTNPATYGTYPAERYDVSWEEWASYGTLSIPSVGINVNLYCAETNGGAQAITDAKNAAACYLQGGTTSDVVTIADHNTQSFKTLKKVNDGDMATIAFPDGSVRKYVVYAKELKALVNNGDGFLLPDGRHMCQTYYTYGMICLHTCNVGNSKTNTVVCLAPVP